jgi:hypothetical protein
VSVALTGCGPWSSPDVDSLRNSSEPRYWLGQEFEGLPITHVDGGLIVYGDCEPQSDTGCAPPLELQHWRVADRHPSQFTTTPGTPAPCVRGRLNGRLVVAFPTSGGLEVYLGETVVVIFAEWERMLRAARALQPLSKSARIADPPPDVRRAVARCVADLSRSPAPGL